MKDALLEFYKLAGFKTTVSKELLKCAHKCIEAAYAWENDKVRKACKKARVTQAVSDKTADMIDGLYDSIHDDLFRCLDKNAERASLLAEEEIGDDRWETYKRLIEENT